MALYFRAAFIPEAAEMDKSRNTSLCVLLVLLRQQKSGVHMWSSFFRRECRIMWRRTDEYDGTDA